MMQMGATPRSSRRQARHQPACRLAFPAAAAAAAAALAAAGCGGGTPAPHPPGATSSPTLRAPASSPASSMPVTPQAAVIAAYTASWTASDKAERSGNAAAARGILVPYVTSAYIATVVTGMSRYWARHEVDQGYVTPHVTTIRVYGNYAIVVDCQDDSHLALADSATGKVIAGSFGAPHVKLGVSLIENRGRWLVSHITFAGNSCSA
jgi:hypothetical protein